MKNGASFDAPFFMGMSRAGDYQTLTRLASGKAIGPGTLHL